MRHGGRLFFCLFFISLSSIYARYEGEKGELLSGVFECDTALFQPNHYERAVHGYGAMTEEDFANLSPDAKSQTEMTVGLMEEARRVFSGILYGYKFVYDPSDERRRAVEKFTLTPVAQIKTGDPFFKVVQTRVNGDVVSIRFSYEVQDFQRDHLRAGRSNSLRSANATGSSSLTDGFGSRSLAIDQGIKEVIRASLRQSIKDKPRRVSGVVFLNDAPRLFAEAGEMRAVVDASFSVGDVWKFRPASF